LWAPGGQVNKSVVNVMVATKKKQKKTGRKSSNSTGKASKTSARKTAHKSIAKAERKTTGRPSLVLSVPLSTSSILPPPTNQDRTVFSIDVGSISGETTIGDLIVAFPRTRDVLMKHGLRFDVEEAGYLYMTLNVFSAIHGLASNNLIQELHTASKEPSPQPPAQVLRPLAATPSP
jgi:hypothetical protein